MLTFKKISPFLRCVHTCTLTKASIRQYAKKLTKYQKKNLLIRSVFEVQEYLKNGSITAEELATIAISRAKELEGNPYITITESVALEQAKKSDERRSQGKTLGPLDGIPFSLKDAFCTKDIRTTMGSKMLSDYIPPYDCTVYTKLKEAGAVLIGKTNCDEFGMGSGTIYSAFGETLNWWANNKKEPCVPGGSSGGSAVSVAAMSCYFSLGTDTGGSVRQPAAFTGTIGLKPTYGLCSRHGMIPYASSLDTVGIFARAVEDVAAALDTICGFDPNDSTSRSTKFDYKFHDGLLDVRDLKGMKVGVPIEYFIKELNAETVEIWRRSLQLLKDAGAEIRYVSLPHTKYCLPTYYVLASAEASSNLARYDGVRFGHKSDNIKSLKEHYSSTRTEGFGPEVKRRIIAGTFALSVDKYDTFFKKAQQVRRLITKDFEEVFAQGIDILCTPTTPTTAKSIEEFKKLSPVEQYMGDIYTVPANLAGLPAISVPVCLSARDGMPMGMQFISYPLGERNILRAAQMFEYIGQEQERKEREAMLKAMEVDSDPNIETKISDLEDFDISILDEMDEDFDEQNQNDAK